jgi:hypothetical protein
MDTAQPISDFSNTAESTQSSLPFRTFLYSALGLGTIAYYIRFGAPIVTEYYLNGTAIPNLHLAIVALIAVLTVTAIGCSIHVRILGGFEKSEIEREVKKEIGRLRNIYSTANTLIAEVEAELFNSNAVLTPKASESLRHMKKILRALEKRIQSTASLAATKNLPELCRATEMLRKKIKPSESAATSLIDVDPFPAIFPDQIESVITNLSKELHGYKRLAA